MRGRRLADDPIGGVSTLPTTRGATRGATIGRVVMGGKRRRFEEFAGLHRGRAAGEPALTITAEGRLALNATAFRALGEPRAVALLYSPDGPTIGVRPVAEDYENAVLATSTRNSCLIAGRQFLRHYGIPYGASVRFPATIEDGVLVADISGYAGPAP
jgi:hypothetical protein